MYGSKSLKDIYGDNDDTFHNKGLLGTINKQKVDLVIGGPPCQAYSLAGRAQDENSMQDDYRNFLFESFIEIVSKLKPKYIMFENVPGILSAKPGNVLVTERIFNEFKKVNYRILPTKYMKTSLLNSINYGIAQKRKRVIIIGEKIDKKKNSNLEIIYKKLHKVKLKQKSVKDVIGNLPKHKPLNLKEQNTNKKISHIQGKYSNQLHRPRFHNKRDIDIFKKWITKKMNYLSSSEKIDFYKNHPSINRKSESNSTIPKYRNLEWNKPSPTIVAHLMKDGLMFIHPDAAQARSITVLESALLQSFPEDFEFTKFQGKNYKMIGNAVPPVMGEKIANIMSEFM